MTYGESHLSWYLWKIYRPLLIKLLCGYTSIILCKIRFGILCLTPARNSSCRKNQRNIFIKNLTGTINLTSDTVYCINIGIRESYIFRFKNYTPANYINICWSQTKCIMMNHISNLSDEILYLFIYKLIFGYTFIIVYNISFGLLFLTLTWNALRKKLQQNHLINNIFGTKSNIKHSILYKHHYKKNNYIFMFKNYMLNNFINSC